MIMERQDLWEWVFKFSARQVLEELEVILRRTHGGVTRGKDFLYAPGTIPIMVCAHCDTVHRNLVVDILKDEKGNLYSPQGIGGDDRAGILGILEILARGHKPHVLILDGEESGGRGAREAARKLKPNDIRYLIELDRRGSDDAIFYQCSTLKFEDYVLPFGFTRAYGSFTDICILCPAWSLCGVNFSVGYYNHHMITEYLVLSELEATVNKVCDMLNSVPEQAFVLPIFKASSWSRFDYLGKSRTGTHGQSRGVVGFKTPLYATWVSVQISPRDMSTVYGGDPEDWNSFLKTNQKVIEKAVETFIYEKLEDCIQLRARGIPYDANLDFFSDEDVESANSTNESKNNNNNNKKGRRSRSAQRH